MALTSGVMRSSLDTMAEVRFSWRSDDSVRLHCLVMVATLMSLYFQDPASCAISYIFYDTRRIKRHLRNDIFVDAKSLKMQSRQPFRIAALAQ